MVEHERAPDKPLRAIEVVAAVIRDGATVFAARRAPGLTSEGKWEFPGGKIEPGESPQEALAREIREELAVPIAVGGLITAEPTVVGDVMIRLQCFDCTLLGSRPASSTAHDRMEWIDVNRLSDFNWAEPDLPVVRHLVAGARSG